MFELKPRSDSRGRSMNTTDESLHCERCNAEIERDDAGDDTMHCENCDICLCDPCMAEHLRECKEENDCE